MSEEKPRVVVLGAGYAGLLATVRLAGRHKKADVVLLNPLDTFVERVRLHQYAANQDMKRRPIADVLRGTSARLVLGEATAIDRAEHTVLATTPDGDDLRLGYDYLLLAVGSGARSDAVPGVAEHAYRLTRNGPRSAEALREALPRLNEQRGIVTVVGGGPTGIEAAAEFAEAYPNLHVSLITRGLLAATLGEAARGKIRTGLERLGVDIVENTTVTSIGAARLMTRSGAEVRSDLCLWAGGFAVPSLAADAGLSVNERGQMLVDPFMRSIDDAAIFAAGDAAYPVEEPGAPMRMAAATAAITGAHAADCLARVLAGRPPQRLGFAYAGQGIALGRMNAVGFNSYPDDVPHGPILSGRAAVLVREFFVKFLATAPARERRHPGTFFWFGKGRVRTQPAVAVATVAQRPVAPRGER